MYFPARSFCRYHSKFSCWKLLPKNRRNKDESSYSWFSHKFGSLKIWCIFPSCTFWILCNIWIMNLEINILTWKGFEQSVRETVFCIRYFLSSVLNSFLSLRKAKGGLSWSNSLQIPYVGNSKGVRKLYKNVCYLGLVGHHLCPVLDLAELLASLADGLPRLRHLAGRSAAVTLK